MTYKYAQVPVCWLVSGLNDKQHAYNSSLAQTWHFIPAEYSIKYNANGGYGAPAEQIKYYKGDLKLSDEKPSRLGYIFEGWAATSIALSVTYNAGKTYSADESITLYAVWFDENDLRDAPDFISPNPEQNKVLLNAGFDSDSKMKIAVTIPDNQNISAMLMVSLYDGNGKMMEWHGVEPAMASGNTATLNISFQNEIQPEMTAKVLLVNKTNLVPLYKSLDITPAS